MLLPHAVSPPQALTFTGKCRLRCLYGAVRVLGFAIGPHQPGLPVFSPPTHCALALEALPAARPPAADPRQLRAAARAAMRAHRVRRREWGTGTPGGTGWAPFRVWCGAGRAGPAAISRVVRSGAGPPPPFRVWCGAGPGRHFASSQGPAVPPHTEARVKVMARFSPECAVVLLEHLDTPVTRFLLSLPPLSRLFEAQVSPRRAPHGHPSQWGWVAPPLLLLHQNKHLVVREEPARAGLPCLACLQQSCQYPAAQSTRLYGFTSVFPTFFLLFYRKRKSPASQQRMQFWHPSVS